MIRNKNLWLVAAAFLTTTSMTAPQKAWAQCATTGAITADCDFSSDTTGAITLGNGAGGVTATITADVIIANTIDDDDATPDGAIVTNGTGVAVTQSADIGATDEILALTLGDGDSWNTTADITTSGDITIGGGTTNATLTVDGSGGTVSVNSAAGSGAIEIGTAGVLTISDTTNAVSVGAIGGIDIADGGFLQLNDDNDVTLGEIDGNSAGVGTFIITAGYSTDAAIGSNASLGEVQISGGTLTLNHDVTATTTTFTSGGAGIIVSSGTTLTSDIVGSSGIDTVQLDAGGTITGTLSLGAGNDVLALNGGTITTALDGGSGTADTITLGADLTTVNTIDGFEAIDVSGNTLTVNTALSDISSATQDGINVNGGTLNYNSVGSIDGTIYDDSSTGTVIFGADGNGGTINLGGILEDVDFTLNTGVTVDTNGNALGGSVAVGSITVNASTQLNVNDNITADGDFTNSGTVFIDAGNSLTTNTQTDAAGTFIIEVEHDTAGDSDNAGQLVVSGGDIDLTSATIEIIVPSTSGVISDGAEILIGDGLNTITGGPGSTAQSVVDNSFLYDFTIIDGTAITTPTTDDDLYLVVNQKDVATVSYTENNSTAASMILDTLSEYLDSNIANIRGDLVTASNQDDFNTKSEALLPTLDNSARAAGITTAENTVSLTTQRLAGLRQNRQVKGMATGDVTQGVKVWMQPFIQGVDQDSSNEVDGYTSLTLGMAGGFDNASTFEDMTIGFAFAYANTEIDSENANASESEVNSIMISAYGDYDIDPKSYLNWQIGYTYNDTKTTRYSVGGVAGLDAKADYVTDQYSAYIEAGRDMKMGRYTTVTPNISAAYTLSVSDSYREHGIGGAGLLVKTDDASNLKLGIGADMSWLYRRKSGSYIKPTLHTKIAYDAMSDPLQTTNSFLIVERQTFTTEGAETAKLSYSNGFGFSYFDVDNWEMSAEYDLTYKEDYLAHSGHLKLGYKF